MKKRKEANRSSADVSPEVVVDDASLNKCYGRIRDILSSAHATVARSVNSAQVVAYWLIGREIVEEEQRGAKRAAYGRQLLVELSKRMVAEYGRGYALSNLKDIRRLYLTYPGLLPPRQISHTASGQSGSDQRASRAADNEHAAADRPARGGILNPNLSWSHYRTLLKVANERARAFYEFEASKHFWPVRELERHINTLLFERLARSGDSEALMQQTLAQTATQQPIDMLKNPFVMEFMGLTTNSRFAEAEMEQAIVDNMPAFLREMGPGVTFANRQQRITVDGDHFYVDLVCYHTVLRCHIVVELKCGKFELRDLGQLQFYVNYYDAERRRPDENPTLGLLLCADKNEAVARYTIGKENQRLFANQYVTHLPTEKELQEGIAKRLRALTPSRDPHQA